MANAVFTSRLVVFVAHVAVVHTAGNAAIGMSFIRLFTHRFPLYTVWWDRAEFLRRRGCETLDLSH